MPEEYMERINKELNRTPSTLEDFRDGLDTLQSELEPQFIEKAKQISENGEAEVLLALAELSQRLRLMGISVQPRAAPHNIDLLLIFVGTTSREMARELSASEKINDIDSLQDCIVHAADDIRNVMEKHRLITHRGERLLRRKDRESQYYRLPEIPDKIEGTE